MLSQKEKQLLKTYCSKTPELKSIIEHIETAHRMELSQISHEIRNPVTLLNSYLQLTQSHHPEVTTFSTWKPLVENMTYLRSLLDELSIYNNSGTLNRSKTSLSELLYTMKEDYQASYPDIRITLQITEPIPDGLFDLIKIKSVISNIIRNAIEAPNGLHQKEIIITLEYAEIFTINIANNGLPIPQEHIPCLFEPFITHKKDGTGLGLAIAKNIITAHNGTIEVSSTDNLTCFYIQLPLYK